MPFQKIWILAQKKYIFSPKISFFLCYAQITHLLRHRLIQLSGIISSTCPEVTLDTFGFTVYGACLAAWRAVSCHRLVKMAPFSFGANNALFWSEMYHMLSYSIVRYCIAFHCIIWYILLPYGIAWYSIVLHNIVWYLMLSRGIQFQCTVLSSKLNSIQMKKTIILRWW